MPFKVAADAKAQLARRLTRTVSRSKINADHKGVLTVNLIKATNLAVRALSQHTLLDSRAVQRAAAPPRRLRLYLWSSAMDPEETSCYT